MNRLAFLACLAGCGLPLAVCFSRATRELLSFYFPRIQRLALSSPEGHEHIITFPGISVFPQTIPYRPNFSYNPSPDYESNEMPFDVETIMNFINKTSGPQLPPPGHLLPDAKLLAEDAGYTCEEYKIITADGYILTMHRISRNPWKGSYPILLMHGLLAASDSWLLNSRENSLPYLLADEGYEVWLGNFRTNYYSKAHMKYSSRSKKFWDYSFHEMGIFDLPAMINEVLHVSGAADLIYIGHSMGTTTFLVMGSEVPIAAAKVRTAFLLAPVALQPTFLERAPFVQASVSQARVIYKALSNLGLLEILPRNYYLVKTVQESCGPSKLQNICLDIVASLYGRNRKNIDLVHLGYQLSSIVSGTSARNVHHLGQLFLSGKFLWYDYGPRQNKIIYGTHYPPQYNLSTIKNPIYLYYGDNDILMTPQSVENLNVALPNSKMVRIADPKFTHLDFLFGLNARQVLYDDVISKIKATTITNDIPLIFK